MAGGTKRLAERPLTTFFQVKQPRRAAPPESELVEAIDSSSDEEQKQEQEATEPERTPAQGRRARREARTGLTGMLQRRELMGGRRRQRQQLVRWALTLFRRLPVQLQLAPHWEQQAGALRGEEFYASCLEFDAQGVLLAVGSSNGILALYDFDDVFHRTLNVGQRVHRRELKTQTGADAEVETADSSGPHAEAVEGDHEAEKPADQLLHPIHTIFTPFEVKRIRWNPLNEDEIACSFSNRNEIHIFNLSKFPTKPHRVLKSSSHPSSGYNDLLYLPVDAPTGAMAKTRSRIIGGDMDGAVRMWDPRFPTRPVWSLATTRQPVNALALSPDKQYLVCGNEAGLIMTYDIHHMNVPAFGSKPVPQRKAVINVMARIKPYLSASSLDAALLSSRFGSPGIVSMRLAPHTQTQVLCQLRNDWVVVIDFLSGTVVKLHTFLRVWTPPTRAKANQPASVFVTPTEAEQEADLPQRPSRNSWLSCHRCTGALLFDETIMCTGIQDAASLNVIDLHQLRRAPEDSSRTTAVKEKDSAATDPSTDTKPPRPVERLDRFRIPMSSIVTAVTAHPNQHAVVCGGENMRLQVVGVLGE